MFGLWNKVASAEIHCNTGHGISPIKEETEKQESLMRLQQFEQAVLRTLVFPRYLMWTSGMVWNLTRTFHFKMYPSTVCITHHLCGNHMLSPAWDMSTEGGLVSPPESAPPFTTHPKPLTSLKASFLLNEAKRTSWASDELMLIDILARCLAHKRGWYTGTTQRDGMGREEGGGFRMGNTCIPVADSFWYLAKLIQLCKI